MAPTDAQGRLVLAHMIWMFGFSGSMSDSLDWLLPKPRHTQLIHISGNMTGWNVSQLVGQNCKSKTQYRACSSLDFVFVVHSTKWTSMTQGFLAWVQAQGQNPHVPCGSKNDLSTAGILLTSGWEKKTEFKPVVLCLKIKFLFYLSHSRRPTLIYIYIYIYYFKKK